MDPTIDKLKKMMAFCCFKDEGLEVMKNMYPEYEMFVREHEKKTVREVKNILFPVIKNDKKI